MKNYRGLIQLIVLIVVMPIIQTAELDRKIALSLKKEDNSEVKPEQAVVAKKSELVSEEKMVGVKIRM